eukprot:440956_1
MGSQFQNLVFILCAFTNTSAMQSVLVDDEGVTPGSVRSIVTLPVEGEPNNNLYSNEEEKELYTFLSNNNLLLLYDKLKAFELYVKELETINVNRSEFDELCSQTCLELTGKPHIRIRFKTALQSLKTERLGAVAPPDISENIAHAHSYAVPHFYPPPGSNPAQDNPLQSAIVDHPGHVEHENRNELKLEPLLNQGPGAALPQHVYPSPYVVDKANDNVPNIAHVPEPAPQNIINDKKPFVNPAYRIMVFLRIILCLMDQFMILPRIETKSLVIGGPFGSFLLFVMSILGMYNICKHPISKKSGSLSVLLAATELFYFASRDALSVTCYEKLYPQSMHHFSTQLYFFGIHAMVNLVLACCLGRIIWQYRSEIFVQIHSSKLNAICNYLMFGWVISWELNSLNGIVFGNDDTIQIPTQVKKMLNLWNVFFCTETSFLVG